MRLFLALPLLLSALLISPSGLAAAQAAPHRKMRGAWSEQLRLSLREGMALVVAPAAAAQPEPAAPLLPTRLEELRRGRALIAAGTTLALSGAGFMAGLGSKRICSGHVMVAPFAAGGPVAGAGLAMVMRGAFMLAHVPTEYRRSHRPTPGKRAGMAFGALALAALSQAVMWAVSVPEIIDCSTS